LQHFFDMGKISLYNIAFKGLKEGKHEYAFTIDKSFFELFENSLIDQGNVNVVLILEKRSLFMRLHIALEGSVQLICDRCLEPYDQPITHKADLFVKFGETVSEDGDDVIWILPEEHQLNVAQVIYEYISLSIPLRHVHPASGTLESSCDPDMLEKLDRYTHHESDSDVEPADERWKELKKLLNNN